MEKGARVVVDSSGHPLKVAAGRRLWLLKPNLEELRQLLGVEVPNAAAAVRDAAMPLLGRVENVLATRGPLGAVLMTAQGAWSARLKSKEPPVRTVGCGDHLLAGFISGIAAGQAPERALEVAMAVAVARAMSPRMDEFEVGIMNDAFEQIAIERM